MRRPIRVLASLGEEKSASNWRATAERIIAQLEAEGAGQAPGGANHTRSRGPGGDRVGGGRGHYDPNQPRVPKDDPSHHGGEWTSEGGIGGAYRREIPQDPPHRAGQDGRHIELAASADDPQGLKSFNAVVRILRLTPTQAQQLHREITGQGLSFREILQTGKDMFGR